MQLLFDLFVIQNPRDIIANLWKEILETEEIYHNSNFFEEGGHSLLAARLTSQINTTLRIKVPLTLIFEHQTLGDYTEAIEAKLNNQEAMSVKSTSPNNNKHSKILRRSVNPLQIPLL